MARANMENIAFACTQFSRLVTSLYRNRRGRYPNPVLLYRNKRVMLNPDRWYEPGNDDDDEEEGDDQGDDDEYSSEELDEQD